MHVSLQSKVYLGTCIAISAYNAYSNPVRWISGLAAGVLWGSFLGHSRLQDARKGHQPGNKQGMGWDGMKVKTKKL